MGSTVFCKEGDAVSRRAAQCVMARHPGVKIEFRSPLPAARRLCDVVRDGRLFRPCCTLKAFSRMLRRGAAVAADKTADLAFFPWSAKIAPNILPAADAASGRGMSACIAGWKASPPFKLNGDWKWDSLGSVQSPRILLEAWRAAGQLRRRWIALRCEGRLNVLGQWRGWDLRPLLLPFLEAAANQSCSVIADVLTAEEWCKRRRVRAVIVPQDGGESVRSVIAGARLAGARSFSVQYGYPMDTRNSASRWKTWPCSTANSPSGFSCGEALRRSGLPWLAPPLTTGWSGCGRTGRGSALNWRRGSTILIPIDLGSSWRRGASRPCIPGTPRRRNSH